MSTDDTSTRGGRGRGRGRGRGGGGSTRGVTPTVDPPTRVTRDEFADRIRPLIQKPHQDWHAYDQSYAQQALLEGVYRVWDTTSNGINDLRMGVAEARRAALDSSDFSDGVRIEVNRLGRQLDSIETLVQRLSGRQEGDTRPAKRARTSPSRSRAPDDTLAAAAGTSGTASAPEATESDDAAQATTAAPATTTTSDVEEGEETATTETTSDLLQQLVTRVTALEAWSTDQLDGKIVTAQQSIDGLNKRVAEVTREVVSKVREELMSLVTDRWDTMKLDGLVERLESKEKEQKEAMVTLANATSIAIGAQERFVASAATVASLAQLQEAQQALARLEEKNAETASRLASLPTARVEERLNGRIDELDKNVAAASKAIAEASKAYGPLEERVAAAESTIETTAALFGGLERRITALPTMARVDEMDKAITAGFDTLAQQIAAQPSMTERLDEMDKTIAATTKGFSELHGRITDISAATASTPAPASTASVAALEQKLADLATRLTTELDHEKAERGKLERRMAMVTAVGRRSMLLVRSMAGYDAAKTLHDLRCVVATSANDDDAHAILKRQEVQDVTKALKYVNTALSALRTDRAALQATAIHDPAYVADLIAGIDQNLTVLNTRRMELVVMNTVVSENRREYFLVGLAHQRVVPPSAVAAASVAAAAGGSSAPT
jgi:predicted  nucleic acid-binding Zn-ribbon protein